MKAKGRHFKKKAVVKKEKKTDSVFKTAGFSLINIVNFARKLKTRFVSKEILDAKS